MDIRIAAPGDEKEVAEVHVRAWQVGYRNLLPAAFLDDLKSEDRARRYTFGDRRPGAPTTLVGRDGTGVVGFATVAPARDPGVAGGEVCALYVAPERWGEGLGGALLRAARAQLTQAGYGSAILWLLQGNARAERFYLKDGWMRDSLSRTITVGGMPVETVRMGRTLP